MPPVVFSCTDFPIQIAWFGEAIMAGLSTVIFTLSRRKVNGEKLISSNAKSFPNKVVFLFIIEITAEVAFPEFQVV